MKTISAGISLPVVSGIASAHSAEPSNPVTVVSLDDLGPENIAADRENNIYLSIALNGEIRKLTHDQTAATDLTTDDTELVTTLPIGEGFLTGLVVGRTPFLYACLASFDEDTHGVWRVTPNGAVERFASLPITTLPNGILFLENDPRLLVTDSFSGRLWTVTPNGKSDVWLSDQLLEPDGSSDAPFPVGADGLAINQAGDVFVSNLDKGLIVRVPVSPDGSPGDPLVYIENDAMLEGADGIVFDDDDHLYVAVNEQDKVVHIPSSDGPITPVATPGDGLDFPADVAFVPVGRRGEPELFIANFALASDPPDPSLMRVDLGIGGDTE